MSIFNKLTGSSFGNLRDSMQQGFRGGSFSEGGKSAIKAFDPLISKERLANVLNNGTLGGDIFSQGTMDDQAGAANTAGQIYSLYALGNYGADKFGGSASGGSGTGAGSSAGGAGGWQQYAKMGAGMGGGGGGGQQQNNSNDESQRLQQETEDYMQRKREEEQRKRDEEAARALAEALRSGNGY